MIFVHYYRVEIRRRGFATTKYRSCSTGRVPSAVDLPKTQVRFAGSIMPWAQGRQIPFDRHMRKTRHKPDTPSRQQKNSTGCHNDLCAGRFPASLPLQGQPPVQPLGSVKSAGKIPGRQKLAGIGGGFWPGGVGITRTVQRSSPRLLKLTRNDSLPCDVSTSVLQM